MGNGYLSTMTIQFILAIDSSLSIIKKTILAKTTHTQTTIGIPRKAKNQMITVV